MNLNEKLTQHENALSPHFNPNILQRADTTFQMQFDDDEPFSLKVNDAGFRFDIGIDSAPTLTLYVDCHSTFWNLLYGKIDGMAAFMEGRYRADGNIVLSQLLLYLFANNHPAVAYEVQD